MRYLLVLAILVSACHENPAAPQMEKFQGCFPVIRYVGDTASVDSTKFCNSPALR